MNTTTRCLPVFLVLVVVFALFTNADRNELLKAFPHANLTALRGPMPIVAREIPIIAPGVVVDMSACDPIGFPADSDDVNNLKPGNIKVVMAMGDSISAGMSAKDSTFLSLKEYRGLAYSIGGDSGITTMPNILSNYVPNGLIGASTGVGERSMKTNGYNAAVSGAINIDLLEQAQYLVQKLKADSSIDYNKDWKILTIWIGSNNLCDVCSDEPNNDVDNFEQYVTEAIEYMYDNVPRVFVNLVVNLDITQLDNIDDGLCDWLHSIACGCVVNSRDEVYQANVQYQQRAATIAKTFSSRANKEFTVVVQPFLQNTQVLKRSELSAADCFHPSAYSHSVAAIALWNNMISPSSQKKSAWSLNDVPLCPTKDTLLYTN